MIEGARTMDDIRWGILGTGTIAQAFAQDVAATSGNTLVAIASRDPVRARQFATENDGLTPFGDYRHLAESPNVDIVYVATPHSHHHQHVTMLLEGHKPSLVEKPYAMSAAEAAQLIGVARTQGTFTMDGLWTLCNPLFLELKRRVQSGEIGTPLFFTASIGPLSGPKGHRIEDPDLGGSFLLECGVYPLAVLASIAPDLLMGDDVTAKASFNDRGVDLRTTMTIASSAGVASFHGAISLGPQGSAPSSFSLVGDQGWICVDDLFNPSSATVSRTDAEPVRLHDDRAEARFRWEIEEVAKCLRDGAVESQLVPHKLTEVVMSYIDLGCKRAGIERRLLSNLG